MRPIETALSEHLSEDVTSLATCWRLTRRDGVLIALTSHDRDIVVDGITYRADGGLSATAMRATADLAIDNMEIEGVLASADLSELDLLDGRFDGARVEVFFVNWQAPQDGKLVIQTGTLGRITQKDGVFQADMRGLTDALSRKMTESYSSGCRAELGDRRCKRSLNDFRKMAEVISVSGDNQFRPSPLVEAARFYDFGKIRWHLGANSGLVSEIRRYQAGTLQLFQAPPAPITPGDVFTITAGCDKTLGTCRDKFDNVENFRGDPFVPGVDALLDYPGLG